MRKSSDGYDFYIYFIIYLILQTIISALALL